MKAQNVSAGEYQTQQEKNLTNEEVMDMFMSRFNYDYKTTQGMYKPHVEGSSLKSKNHILGYTINYSYPGADTSPVASFWTHRPELGERGYSIFHIDLHKLVSEFVKHVNKQGYNPPPPKNYQQPTETVQDDDEPI